MNLFKLFATIGIKDSEFKKGISSAVNEGKKLEKSSLGIGGSLDKLVNKGLAAAGAGLTAFGLKAIDTASDLIEVQNVTDTVFGSMSGDIDSWAKTAISQFGLSELQAKQFSGTLGALITSSGISGEKMKEMAVNLTGLSADFASFYNLGHEEAFEKIKAGISGETEPLKALGINMSVTNMEAYALSKGINKSWNEMSQAEQTTLRYNYIMEKGSMASGDFAKTLDTSLANQLRVAKNEFMSLAGEIGSKFVPAITEGVKWIRENKDVLLALGSAALGTLLALKAYTILNTLITLWQAYKNGTLLATLAQKGLNLAMLANPVTWIVAILGALVGVIIYLWNTNEGFRQFWINAWNNIKQGFSDAWNKIKEGFNGMVEWLQTLPSRIKEKLSQALNAVKQWGSNMWSKAKEIARKFTQWLVDGVKSLPNKMLSIGKDIVRGIWNGITGMGGWLMGKISGWADGIVSGIKGFFGIHSPSRVMRDEVGMWMARGVGVGFEEEMDNVNSEIQSSLTVPDVPEVQRARQNDLSALTNAILALANRPNRLEIDGREVMVALAPYQDEFEDYNRIRNVSFA